MAQASARQSLANSMVTALRRKDQEIEELKNSLQTWRDQTAEKVAHLYKTELARELEKYLLAFVFCGSVCVWHEIKCSNSFQITSKSFDCQGYSHEDSLEEGNSKH